MAVVGIEKNSIALCQQDGCDSSSIQDNVRRSVDRSVGQLVGWLVGRNEFKVQYYTKESVSLYCMIVFQSSLVQVSSPKFQSKILVQIQVQNIVLNCNQKLQYTVLIKILVQNSQEKIPIQDFRIRCIKYQSSNTMHRIIYIV